MKKKYVWYRRDRGTPGQEAIVKGTYMADAITVSGEVVTLTDSSNVLAVIHLAEGEVIQAE